MKKLKSILLSLTLSITTIGATLPASAVIAATPETSTGVTMYRLYNPNSGEHFYTCDEGEKSDLVTAGWRYEGVGWKAPIISDSPVYRLYNANAGDHHYTLNVNEKDDLVRLGWNYEGIGWYSDDEKSVPLYREYNPNAVTGTHNYTTNKAEHDNLVKLGWRDEEIGWYGIKDKDDPIDDPVDPTEPEDPTEPTDPTEPVGPVDPTDPTEPTEPEEPKNPEDMLFPNAKIGDYVTFGTYEQDWDEDNGPEPIEWQYIANKDGHKMLLSKYALDVGVYHDEWEDGITWETCDLRKWLNNDFYNTAFSASDKENIVTAHNENPGTSELYSPREAELKGMEVIAGGHGGNDTDDNVFLLSWTEARDLFDAKIDYQEDWGNGYTEEDWAGGEVNPKLICAPTEYAARRVKGRVATFEPIDGVVGCRWWLRSPGAGTFNTAATVVEPDGELDTSTNFKENHQVGVRPVILVD